MSNIKLTMNFLGRQWRLGTGSFQEQLMWPSGARIQQLWEEYVGKGKLQFVIEPKNPCNCRIFSLPKGTTPKERLLFIEAVQAECEPALESL